MSTNETTNVTDPPAQTPVMEGAQHHHIDVMMGGKRVPCIVHPVALLFPEMTETEYSELLRSVKQHGQLQPIVLKSNVILDGRHRLRACAELGLEARTVEFAELGLKVSPASWIFSVNSRRRHLTDDQKLAVLASYDDWFKAQKAKANRTKREVPEATPAATDTNPEAPDPQQDEFPSRNLDGNSNPKRKRGRPAGTGNGRAAEKLAKEANQSRYRAERMIKLHNQSPDLANAVAQGTQTLKEACSKLKTQQSPASETPQICTETARVRTSFKNIENRLRKLEEKCDPLGRYNIWMTASVMVNQLLDVCKAEVAKYEAQQKEA